jgi:hypothetical protein
VKESHAALSNSSRVIVHLSLISSPSTAINEAGQPPLLCSRFFVGRKFICVHAPVAALHSEGIVVVTVAGSQSDDACNYSPASGAFALIAVVNTASC